MINQRKPRRFNYKAQLSKNSKRNELEDDEIKTKWNEIRSNSKRKKSVFTSLPALLVFLVLILIIVYIVEGYIN